MASEIEWLSTAEAAGRVDGLGLAPHGDVAGFFQHLPRQVGVMHGFGKSPPALEVLEQALADAPAGATGTALQNIVYEVGKSNGFADKLRDWFKAIYEVLLGQSQGPRFGSFIELYGVPETRQLIAKGLAGELTA